MEVSVLKQACRTLVAAGAVAAAMMTGAASAQPIKVGYVEFAPYSYTDGNKPAGSLIETLQKVAADQGIEYTIEGTPARRPPPRRRSVV